MVTLTVANIKTGPAVQSPSVWAVLWGFSLISLAPPPEDGRTGPKYKLG